MGVGELVSAPAKSKADTPAVDAVRGFVFLSGIRWMKQRGVYDRFVTLLPEAMRKSVFDLGASEWVPIAESLAAYAACDALELSVDDQIDLGRFVATANNGVVLDTLVRLLGRVASPWLVLQNADRLWRRSNRGGAVAVYKLGDKSARLEFWNVPMARSRFFVTSMRGSLAAGLEPFCERLVVTELVDATRSNEFSLRAAW